MKFTGYKCRFDGKIFASSEKKAYVKYLKNIRKNMKTAREDKRTKDNTREQLSIIKLEVTDVNMIAPWIMKHEAFLIKACNVLNLNGFLFDEFKPNDKYTNVEIGGLFYNENTSNSHVCPHNGVTNWGDKNPDLPTGYPGWYGRLGGSLYRDKKNMNSYPYSSVFKLIGVHTGSGGGGNERFSYDCKIFVADWPCLLQKWVDVQFECESRYQERIDAIFDEASRYQEHADLIFDREVNRFANEKDNIIRKLKGERLVQL